MCLSEAPDCPLGLGGGAAPPPNRHPVGRFCRDLGGTPRGPACSVISEVPIPMSSPVCSKQLELSTHPHRLGHGHKARR
ncbi:unnamed protein product [Gulo gulo]|uniref:Uncharacterized protein n=1 Tax=Gulo gulo TaxID=48420 RepID=A0A9X9M3K4_GULGU|nr:unnamed protein product [Gulo gulo]